MCDRPLSSPYPSLSPCLFLPKPRSLPSSALSSSPTHLVIHCAIPKYSYPAFHNESHTQLQLPPLCLKGVPALTHRGGCCKWRPGLRQSWDSPGRGPDRSSHFSESLIWVLTCFRALCSFGLVEMGVWWADGPWDGPGRSWGRVLFELPPPAIFSVCSFVSVQMSFLAHNLIENMKVIRENMMQISSCFH